jgi:hypothetical protein
MPLALLAAVAAALPLHGTLVPDKSLGGIKLGDSSARVLRIWGPRHGVCSNCAQTTWYYNYVRYEPQGAGVEFVRGRVGAVFTLWSPSGWRATSGLRLGEPAGRIKTVYGSLPVEHCGTYDAYVLVGASAVTVFYVVGTRVWGFGLTGQAVSVCR